MCGKKNFAEISKFSEADAANYEKYEHELEQFVQAVDPLLGKDMNIRERVERLVAEQASAN